MSPYVKRKFTKVYCKKCDRMVAEVLKGSEVYCYTCSTWLIAGDVKTMKGNPLPVRRAS